MRHVIEYQGTRKIGACDHRISRDQKDGDRDEYLLGKGILHDKNVTCNGGYDLRG